MIEKMRAVIKQGKTIKTNIKTLANHHIPEPGSRKLLIHRVLDDLSTLQIIFSKSHFMQF